MPETGQDGLRARQALLECDGKVQDVSIRRACLEATAQLWSELETPLPAIAAAARNDDAEIRIRAIAVARLVSLNLCDVLSMPPKEDDAKMGIGRALWVLADQWLAHVPAAGSRRLKSIAFLHDDGYYIVAIRIQSNDQRLIAHQVLYDLVDYLRSKGYDAVPYSEEAFVSPSLCGTE